MTEDLFTEQKTFAKKQDIKPWLQQQLQPRGITIVIERSDDSKVVFKCRSNKNYADVKQAQCPFRIRANYSVRHSCWNLVVISAEHNHPLEPGVRHTSMRHARARAPSQSVVQQTQQPVQPVQQIQQVQQVQQLQQPQVLQGNYTTAPVNMYQNLSNQLSQGYYNGSKISSLQLELNSLLIQFNSTSCKNKEEIYTKLINMLKDSMGYSNPYYAQFNISEPLLLPQLPSLQPIRNTSGDFIKL